MSGNISQRVVNRPNSARGTIISGDNITTSESKTSYNGSYGIDANWTVYNGSKRVNTVKQQKLNNRIAELNVDESENSIEESITQLYVQILYSAEAVKVNESTRSKPEKSLNGDRNCSTSAVSPQAISPNWKRRSAATTTSW